MSDYVPAFAVSLDPRAGNDYTCVQTKDNADIAPGDSANCPGGAARKGEALPMRGNRSESTPTGERPQDAEIDQEAVEAAIISMLLNDEHQLPWTRAEVEREMGASTITTYDALVALRAAGLLHMHGELVIVSRAARRMDGLAM